MPSSVRPRPSQSSHAPSKKKFRSVLGLASVFRDLDANTDNNSQQPIAEPATRSLTLTRKSLDTATTLNFGSTQRKHKLGRASIADTSFFTAAQSPTPIDAHFSPVSQSSFIDITVDDDMKPVDVNVPHPLQSGRRGPVRMDTQDGPWSISVAESPHNARSYILYIKTPTHNLTLTRTAMEIVELDQKLRDSTPDIKLPPMPIDPSTLPNAPPKRKSTFLNTLSRLASPSHRQTPSRRMQNVSVIPSGLPTPLTSPSGEIGDPFSSFSSSTGQANVVEPAPTSGANSTAIAAYLTTVSNTHTVRQTRVWKRFVRVRTDDLESVRVERAIKRVRSDLAAHVHASNGHKSASESQPLPTAAHTHAPISPTIVSIINGDLLHQLGEDGASGSPSTATYHLDTEVDEGMDVDAATAERVENATPESPLSSQPNTEVESSIKPTLEPGATREVRISDAAENGLSGTPVAAEPPSTISRMHRSQSADPDRASRLSRAFASSSTSSTSVGADVVSSSQEQSQTEDESSVSASGLRKKNKKEKRERGKQTRDGEAEKKKSRKVVIDDFEMMRVLGKGCAGKVLLVRHKPTQELFALKAITKRHVLAHQELQHTLTEQAVLKRMAAENKDPFVVKLWWSFHDKENLFLVMDFHPGGDLATQLARWGRLGRDRARFYAAEIVEGVEGLHAAGVIYRDLKPENILIGSDGHIVLTDFGLSKEFPRRHTAVTAPSTPSGRGVTEFYNNSPATPATPPWMRVDPASPAGELGVGWPGQPVGQNDSTSTFCGTAEYLAPEVIQGLPYSYEVDWWSFGTMLYEMLTGITPFWANNHSDMYVRVLQDELQFPDDRAIDQDTKSLIRGLLQRNPVLRICEPRIKRHPYFSMIDWSHVFYKRYIPPYIPPIDPSNASDTQNFDDTFLDMEPVLDDFNDPEQGETDQEPQTDADDESNTTPSQSRSSSIHPQPVKPEADDSVDVFDGYSFKGRHSVLIDDEEAESSESSESEEMSLEDVGAKVSPGEVEPSREESDEVAEPKTPEARPHALPQVEKPPQTPEPAPSVQEEEPQAAIPAEPEAKPRTSEQQVRPQTPESPVPPIPSEEDAKPKVQALPKPVARPAPARQHRPRREKSGIPALDRYLSDTIDEDEEATERDDEDDDWDFIESVDGEDRNGTKGTSLFARGVVDRYRLAVVFRKASVPSQKAQPRSVSGTSQASEATVAADGSPSPSQRRGRAPLTFRKHPRQFLRAKSPGPPPSSFSSKSSLTAKSLARSGSATLSAGSTQSSTGLLTPSTSMAGSLASPSLKSKESTASVGNRSLSSSQSGGETGQGDSPTNMHGTIKGAIRSPEEPEKQKNRKLKKYKENAEKVFSIFSSPR